MDTPQAQPSPISGNLYCMAAMLVWATAFPCAATLLPILPPLPLTSLRLGLAVVFLLALWVAIEGVSALKSAPWGKGMLIGGIGFGAGSLMLIYAQALSDPVTVAVISATMPVVGILLEVVFDGRKPHRWLYIGLVLSVIGGVLAYANGLSKLSLGIGALLAFLSVTAYIVASRLTVKHLPTMTTLGSSAVTLAGAALAVFLVTFIGDLAGAPKGNWAAFGTKELFVALIYGIGSLALSQILWVAGVKGLGVGIAAMHINAAPFYVMVYMLALGSPWNWWQALGAAVVAFAVVVAQNGPEWRRGGAA
jgi:drug/metabolite transporter (DMT)-like permease